MENSLLEIENLCRSLTHFQLSQLEAEQYSEADRFSWSMTKSKTEQNLAKIFSFQSPFWEKYYGRLNYLSKDSLLFEEDTPVSTETIHEISKCQFPYFYTVLDAMYFIDGNLPSAYLLLELSLQTFLEGIILKKFDFIKEGDQVLSNALQFLGHLPAKSYSDLIHQCMEEFHTT
jgi:hypothetical protein